MTCIVAVKDTKAKTITIGGDSCGGDPEQYTVDSIHNPKVFNIKEFLFGYTDSFRMGQIIEHCFTPPVIPKTISMYRYMVTKFIPALQKVLKNQKWARNNNGKDYGGEFIVCIRGHIYRIQNDFSVLEFTDDFAVCGCGISYAKGSLLADKRDEAAVERALTASSYFSAFVLPPFHIISRKYR